MLILHIFRKFPWSANIIQGHTTSIFIHKSAVNYISLQSCSVCEVTGCGLYCVFCWIDIAEFSMFVEVRWHAMFCMGVCVCVCKSELY